MEPALQLAAAVISVVMTALKSSQKERKKRRTLVTRFEAKWCAWGAGFAMVNESKLWCLRKRGCGQW